MIASLLCCHQVGDWSARSKLCGVPSKASSACLQSQLRRAFKNMRRSHIPCAAGLYANHIEFISHVILKYFWHSTWAVCLLFVHLCELHVIRTFLLFALCCCCSRNPANSESCLKHARTTFCHIVGLVVWCTTQLAKLSFNHSNGCTHSWRFSTFYKNCFFKSWKTSAVMSATDWMIETQLCKLRGISDTFSSLDALILYYFSSEASF